MVHVVVIGTGPEGQDVAQAPGEVVAAVGIDGLEETKDDPDIHGDEMKVTGDGEQNNRRTNDTHAEEHSLNRRSVLGGQTKWSRIGVVHLVNSLIKRSVVQSSMEPVVPGILHDE